MQPAKAPGSRLRIPPRRRDVGELGHLAVHHELREGRAALFAPAREAHGGERARLGALPSGDQ